MKLSKGKKILFTTTLIFAGTYFMILCLVKGQGFLAPLVMSIVLALLMIPLANKMEKRINRTFSSLLCTFILFLISLGVFALLSFQLKNFVDDWDTIKEKMKPKIEQAENYIYEHTNYTKEDLEEYQEKNNITAMGGGSSGEKAFTFMSYVMSFIGNYLLTFIYIFFLLNYRRRFKIFILKLAPGDRQEKTLKIINKTAWYCSKIPCWKIYAHSHACSTL
ncbi:AI-2E family transporter [Antarcticibacterium sp. 1MA-6-2]|uniref:AI-2E family transporter n=1 Tax=Antarcticibacterium sp. 1MA-6-2 TaxID=2908210 RepID=UPI002103FAA9|nr:AI-2E family transporter [Antarcticibacterium sp. 1MA-6-2]